MAVIEPVVTSEFSYPVMAPVMNDEENTLHVFIYVTRLSSGYWNLSLLSILKDLGLLFPAVEVDCSKVSLLSTNSMYS